MSSKKQRDARRIESGTGECLPELDEIQKRYLAAMADIQHGIRLRMSSGRLGDPNETDPDALRTGILAMQIENHALVNLLVTLGVFTKRHYFFQMMLAAEAEAARQERGDG